MKFKYTVIFLDDTTGVVGTCVQTADDQHEAMRITANEIEAKNSNSSNIQIICAVTGDVETCPPCEDSGKAAYVADLTSDEELIEESDEVPAL